ncbi:MULTISPECIES: ion transporter [unclassified Cupriavidus]|uniref:ion transporter n=1 Tax=unclassified Cupriavidus TaxID=2640874 RepID=UPI0003F5DC4D|nr:MULTISPECIES: ion transporter [unclassified Cupriavidus]MBP0627913.1 ion transporter [Cupriavidus sp. AcVe19-1a]MBP0633802.1 ion transporter [Cupriavidus sp. AcVe19-6a]
MANERRRQHQEAVARQRLGQPETGWRQRWYTIIFEADTREGRLFDVSLLIAIVASVMVVMLDSMAAVHSRLGLLFTVLEWTFTLFFTAEYVMRILVVRRPWRYVISFYGIIDFISIMPTWLAFFVPELHFLIDVRLLRLLRVFRILKLTVYFEEAEILYRALVNSRRKIFVFLGTVFIITVILGTVMHVVEGPEHGFHSIPVSMYWAVVTLTTTGFGDMVPKTPLGQFITSLTILLGYGIIAFPTGIVGAELAASILKKPLTTRTCTHCLTEGHEPDAKYCKHCGSALPDYQNDRPEVPGGRDGSPGS